MGNKTSFVLYHDIRAPLELLTDDQRGKLFLAILDYSERGVAPEFDGELRMAFAFIRTALDRDAAAWESKREKRVEAGRKGGRQTAANQASASFANQNEQVQANQAVPAPVPVPVPVPAPVPVSGCNAAPRAKRFTPPTLAEVQSYVAERHSPVDPQEFIDFYAAKGWMVGKNPMRDWKAACRNAEKWGRWNRPHDRGGRVKTGADYQGQEDFFNA